MLTVLRFKVVLRQREIKITPSAKVYDTYRMCYLWKVILYLSCDGKGYKYIFIKKVSDDFYFNSLSNNFKLLKS